ncbi:Crp/Fnr family transcriptional regulator [Chondrinema litorale]|uniref:Crp/Fnr family transcriptional regulator n=1 Tax=Chondrinema litorale TaxID=2994555 RepID=UPI0025434044|nr:Crp/Fnr family transcriptional regulator [Chondrinema litorale]UZR97677.1 Crp/Fnr family transcriptional regulator [Chondrinema litorale]
MENAAIKFISQFITLSKEDEEILLKLNLVKEFKKGTNLLKEGELAKNCYLVLKGCIRSYYLVDGEEKITEFYTEHQPVTPVSYTTKKPSEYYLETLEDCILSLGTPASTKELIKQFPRIETVSLFISNQLLVNSQVSFDNYRNLSPEQRYFKLLETRQDLCNRVPQYMLASYLGIQPQSLSRIRRRIKENKV